MSKQILIETKKGCSFFDTDTYRFHLDKRFIERVQVWYHEWVYQLTVPQLKIFNKKTESLACSFSLTEITDVKYLMDQLGFWSEDTLGYMNFFTEQGMYSQYSNIGFRIRYENWIQGVEMDNRKFEMIQWEFLQKFEKSFLTFFRENRV